ncbi:MAG: transglycosylase SLT domain-containing protein [Acidobacteria bacterium]|nr:transglycosylase SLT domain-containing protein [Acidobacteriota bacterium]
MVWLALAILIPATASPDDQRLAALAARAKDRSIWPALRTLAEGMTDVEQRGRAYFVLGYRENEANDFPSGARDLRLAVETGFSLSDYARYYGALASRDAGEMQQAVNLLEDFPARHSQSNLRWVALQQLSDLLVDLKRPDRAIRILLSEPQTRLRPELYIELAHAYRAAGNAREAVRSFQDIYYRFPLAGEADEAEGAMAELRQTLGGKYPEANEELQTLRADVLSQNYRWRDAQEAYSGLLERLPSSPLVPRWRLGKAQSLFRMRKTDQAMEILMKEVPPSAETEPERLQLLIEASIRKSDIPGARKYLGTLGGLYPKSPRYAEALDAFGNYYVRWGDWTTAAKYYQPLAENFPSTDAGEEAHWWRTWSFYLAGDLNRARAGFAEHVTLYPESDHVPGALYWLGRIDEKRGAVEDAKAWYSYLSRRFEHSYFAAKGYDRLQDVVKTNPAPKPTEIVPVSIRPIVEKIPRRPPPSLHSCGQTVKSDLLQTYFVLRQLSLTELAEQYLLDRLEVSSHDPALSFTLSRLRAERGATTFALFDARRSSPRYAEYEFGELPEEFWTLLYPRDYLPVVESYAQKAGLDPHLVLGLIRQESAFNPLARSVANARGLMQILPSTASPGRKGRARVARQLYDPEFNVQFGTRYLRDRLAALGEIPELALAAYHAGERRVKEWRDRFSFQEPAEFLETIPIPSTRVYVEAVLRDAGIYRKLLDGSAQFAKCQ